MSETITKAKTNEQITEQVGRITQRLLNRAVKLNLPDKIGGLKDEKSLSLPGTIEKPGMTITTKVGQETSGIAVSKSSETGNGSDSYAVEIPSRNGTQLDGQGFKTTKQHTGWVESPMLGREARVLSTTGVEAFRESGRYSPMTVVRSQETAGVSSAMQIDHNAENQPINPETTHAAAQTLSEIRSGLAAAEIAQQQGVQTPSER